MLWNTYSHTHKTVLFRTIKNLWLQHTEMSTLGEQGTHTTRMKCQVNKRFSCVKTRLITGQSNDDRIVTYRGISLQSSGLRFNWHVAETVQKAWHTRAALYPVLNHCNSIPVRIKLNNYKMYIKTIITYSHPAWGALITNSNWRRLEALQNLAYYYWLPWFVRNTIISNSTQIPLI